MCYTLSNWLDFLIWLHFPKDRLRDLCHYGTWPTIWNNKLFILWRTVNRDKFRDLVVYTTKERHQNKMQLEILLIITFQHSKSEWCALFLWKLSSNIIYNSFLFKLFARMYSIFYIVLIKVQNLRNWNRLLLLHDWYISLLIFAIVIYLLKKNVYHVIQQRNYYFHRFDIILWQLFRRQ